MMTIEAIKTNKRAMICKCYDKSRLAYTIILNTVLKAEGAGNKRGYIIKKEIKLTVGETED